MTLAFAAASFWSAALLFALQPMVGRILLPSLGGAPAVWGTCMVFFQASVLLGYAYAHVLSRLAPIPAQILVHGGVLAAGWACLRFANLSGAPPAADAFPVGWLLARLASSVGPGFCAASATAPLLQRWFASTRHPLAADPYPLYAASNAGSLLALLAYPAVVEPMLGLGAQASLWSRGYLGLCALELVCAALLLAPAPAAPSPTPSLSEAAPRASARWLALAFVPSSVMLGATTFSTTDIAPVPLLWVVPLSLYLLSFVLCFLRRAVLAHETSRRLLPLGLLALAFLGVAEITRPFWLVVPVHLGAMFLVAMACHGELARTRPAAGDLTRFYLVVSLGGALGGAFNALVAPRLFDALLEYPLALAAAAGLRHAFERAAPAEAATDWRDLANPTRAGPSEPRRRARDAWRLARMPLAVGVAASGCVWAARKLDPGWGLLLGCQVATAVCVVAWAARARTARFALALAALLFAPRFATWAERPLFEARSFFAVHRVVVDRATRRHLYVQGTTIHGLQSALPDRKRVPGAYFHRSGPAGDVLSRWRPARVGLVGLGVGSLAAYAERGQSLTFFEIDPVVERIAETPSLFTFLSDARARGASVGVVLGDARVRLQQAEDGAFEAIVIDAYSSDVVPTHLLTLEAMRLYASKLAPAGRVIMNVSNRYLDVGKVVAAAAQHLGWSALERTDTLGGEHDERAAREDGKAVSRWILVARAPGELSALELGPGWKPLERTGMEAWTDDHVSLVSCLRWF